MQLSAAQLRQYRDEGYTVVRGLIPAELLKPVRDCMIQIMHGDHDWPSEHFQVLDPTKYRNPKGGYVTGGIQLPARRSETFRRIADHPELQAAMSQLLGGPVQRFTDQALIKTAWIKEEQAGQTFYHQDSYYWHIDPRLGCNAWIALDDVGPDAIALGILPGTHRDWRLVEHEDYYDDPSWNSAVTGQPFKRHRIPLARIDPTHETVLAMEPGDAAFFTNYTWHRSEKNKSGKHLCAYAIAYRLTPQAAAAAG
jgi:hypothetical protein